MIVNLDYRTAKRTWIHHWGRAWTRGFRNGISGERRRRRSLCGQTDELQRCKILLEHWPQNSHFLPSNNSVASMEGFSSFFQGEELDSVKNEVEILKTLQFGYIVTYVDSFEGFFLCTLMLLCGKLKMWSFFCCVSEKWNRSIYHDRRITVNWTKTSV